MSPSIKSGDRLDGRQLDELLECPDVRREDSCPSLLRPNCRRRTVSDSAPHVSRAETMWPRSPTALHSSFETPKASRTERSRGVPSSRSSRKGERSITDVFEMIRNRSVALTDALCTSNTS